MKTIEFDFKHETVFTQNGLNSFDDFIDCIKGQMINRNKKRSVTILHLASLDGPRIYFIKRFFSPHLKDMLFTVRNFGKLCSQAELELRNAHILLGNGIETYHPVCWGAQTCCGIKQRSFFITEKIKGMSLIEFLFDQWKNFDASKCETLVIAMAQFFRKLHQARVCLPDSYLWHLFLLEPIDMQKPCRLAIIDLHRMRINAAASGQAALNLGALLFSMPHEWFDDRLRELFLNVYVELTDGSPIADHNAFLEAVIKREQTLMARRQKPDLEYLKTMM